MATPFSEVGLRPFTTEEAAIFFGRGAGRERGSRGQLHQLAQVLGGGGEQELL
jgi:hypothetical protein